MKERGHWTNLEEVTVFDSRGDAKVNYKSRLAGKLSEAAPVVSRIC